MSQTPEPLTHSVPGMSWGHCRAAIDDAGYDIA